MTKSAHKPKRIPLLFLLGIGIPCLLLGYLAFRGIQNDQALQEKERSNEYRKILEQVTKSVDDSILSAEQASFYVISGNQEFGQSGLIRSLDSLKDHNHLVEEVFFYESSGEIQLPAARLLYHPGSSTQSSSGSLMTTISHGNIWTGQQSEFQEKNYQKALASYRQEFERNSEPHVKGELLNAIGRVQKKSSLFQEAIKTYKLVEKDFNQMRTTGGVPLGLAARSELYALYMAIDDTLAAIRTIFDLYKDLLDGQWIVDKGQYDFFSQHIRESAGEIFSKMPLAKQLQPFQSDFTKLKAYENERKNITERLLLFQENSAEDLKAKVPGKVENPQIPAIRLTLESRDQTYLVSLLGQFEGSVSQGDKIYGLVLDADYLRDSLLSKVIQENNLSSKVIWLVKGREGETILKSYNAPAGSVTARSNFEGGFPPWSVEFYQQTQDFFEAFLFSRRGIYFFVFFLLAGILIFGLILTIRTVSHELEVSKMKSDFVSTISHEFKSPLSSIRQLSEMLQSGRVPSDEYRQQYYDVLVEQSERLSFLIDNILDFSKIEEGKKEFDFRMIDSGPLLKETVSAIQDQVRHKKFDIQLKIDEPLPTIQADRAAIAQAVTNLIDNAVKYSGDSRKIIVSAFAEDRNLVIEVEDFGIGISKEEINKIFERFYRVGDELTRQVKGSGLGLTLVKQIVDVHQGNVQVESEPGKGSRFTIVLPLTEVENDN